MGSTVVFTNGPVFTAGPDARVLEPGHVVVEGGIITRVGSGPAPAMEGPGIEVVDLSGRLLMPGLVNSHTHAAMTLFRGLADDLPLMDWLNGYIFPAERRLTSEWVRWGTRLACLEMILSGTTTFCDMYLFEQVVAEVADESGLRALVGEVLYDFPSPNYGSPENGLAYTRDLIARWSGHDRVRIAVEPHAPYTCSPALLRSCSELSRELGVPLIIHLAETATEVAGIRAQYGRTPIAHLGELDIIGPELIADHVVCPEDDDLALLASGGASVVHNPESNMKLASGCAPVAAMLAAGIPVGLGTDGCASNNDLDMFGEMDTTAKLHKVTSLDPTALPARQVLELATSTGARALKMGDRTGSIAPGKAADLIVVDFGRPHLTPVYDYLSHLVYAVRGADVCDSMVGGRWLMRDGVCLTLDAGEIMARVHGIADEIRAAVL